MRIFFNIMSYLNCEYLFAGSYLPLGNNFYFSNHQDRMQMPQYGLVTEVPELHGSVQEVGGYEPPIQMAEYGSSQISEYGIVAATPQYMPSPRFYQYGQNVGGYEPPIQMAEYGSSQIPQYGMTAGTPQYMPSPGFYQYGPVQDVGGWKSLIPLFKNSSWSKVTGYKPILEVSKEKRMTEESNSASSAQVPTYTPSSIAFEIEPATEVLVCEPTAESIAETPVFSGSMECLLNHNKVSNSPTDVVDTSQTISSDLDQCGAGNFTEHTDIAEINEPEIHSNTNRERKIDELSDISDDEEFLSNNFDEQKNEDLDYSPEQFTETVDDLYIHRPLKWAFINLERFSLVNEIIYEEDEFEFENASSEDDDSIHTDSELINNEHSDDDVESIKEIEQKNVESDVSSISSMRDDIEEENFVNNTNSTSLQVIQSTKSEESKKGYDNEQKEKQELQDLTECENSKNEDDRFLSKDETIEEYERETTNCMDIFWHFLRKFPSVLCPCLKRRK
ncbi:uncharacterized protein [Centruroides vittatus]|uniref:uncharacterized protein n=1 Tax=Centruroides vittatus TaxID=120091 RepID=UPI00350FA14A